MRVCVPSLMNVKLGKHQFKLNTKGTRTTFMDIFLMMSFLARYLPNFTVLPSNYLLIQSQHWKHQNNVLNLVTISQPTQKIVKQRLYPANKCIFKIKGTLEKGVKYVQS